MTRIVLDTNIFIAALLRPDKSSRLVLRQVLDGKHQGLMGDVLFYEYESVLSRKELFAQCPISPKEREELFNAFVACCEWVKIYYKWRPNLRDEGDNHLIELAIAGGATTIITKNVRDLKSGELYFKGLGILTPEELLREKGHGNHYLTIT